LYEERSTSLVVGVEAEVLPLGVLLQTMMMVVTLLQLQSDLAEIDTVFYLLRLWTEQVVWDQRE